MVVLEFELLYITTIARLYIEYDIDVPIGGNTMDSFSNRRAV
jgi:hypothetical protein